MKKKKKELDVDFIGGLGPLTKEEEKKISEFFFMQNRAKSRKSSLHTTKAKRKGCSIAMHLIVSSFHISTLVI